ncbi:nucleotide sugar dehydrogenase [Marinivivus vitaminiproducens]|uniref:nucleotide sugar dehydrogenase n=1 Tax=Marinivivus vitaminiproducens TaxID=3035935 RepID=UPI003F9FA179
MPSAHVDHLIERIEARDYVVGIVGLGYVGLPLTLAALASGFPAIGFDVDAGKVEQLNAGLSPYRHIQAAGLSAARAAERFEATTDFAAIADADAILICVPTPLGVHREPDLSFVDATARLIAPHLRPGQLIVLESTTYPGTTRELLQPILESSGLVVERDLFLAYSPEREDPGNREFGTATIPKVVGGIGEQSTRLTRAFYDSLVVQTVTVSSADTAEAVKLTENIFRAVNIALVNELKQVYASMGIDIWEVIAAAKTKPFGFMAFFPGPGLGGHCIPIDPFYLTWRAREHGITTRFIELAGEVNHAMPAWVIGRLADALDRRFQKSLCGSRLLVVGVAYKKNVDDMRESPALAIMDMLHDRGALVDFHDPCCPEIPPTREHMRLAGMRSVPLTPAVVGGFDAVLIVTDHDAVDYQALIDGSRLVVDTRNATHGAVRGLERVVRA